MTWTPDQIEKIPEVYRDFMMSLKPIIDTRQSVMTVSAIPLGSVFNALLTRYPYTPQQVRQIAITLDQQGLINFDRSTTFITPTGRGESLIQALAGSEEGPVNDIPPFPDIP